jgi:HPt (histidine-containing phosphotransfer) domain-containing protein
MRPGIDPDVLRRTVGNDPVLMREVIEDFVPAAQAGIDEIRAAVESATAAEVRLAAHKLKGSAALVGARSLTETCAALEEAGEEEDWPMIRALAIPLDDQMAEIQRAAADLLRSEAR